MSQGSLAVTVHGTAHLFDVSEPSGELLRQAMLDQLPPCAGSGFEEWPNGVDAGARIEAARTFTFSLGD